MNLKKVSLFLLICSLCIGSTWLSLKVTKGFRYYLLLSNLPNSPNWQTPSLTAEEKSLLDQPFTFLGRGGWCFAFLGEDQKTVLKLFKHDHLRLSHLLLKSTTPPHLDSVFKSIMLLYNKMPQESGLIHVHLNKTVGECKKVTLIDPCGIRHTLDLDATEFVLQKKAELVYKHLNKQIRANDIAGAQQSIDSLLAHLLLISEKGIRDTDRCIGFNFGFTEEGAMTVDIGSFVEDNQVAVKQELFLKTMNLNLWLKARSRPLHRYYVDKLVSAISQDKNSIEQ